MPYSKRLPTIVDQSGEKITLKKTKLNRHIPPTNAEVLIFLDVDGTEVCFPLISVYSPSNVFRLMWDEKQKLWLLCDEKNKIQISQHFESPSNRRYNF